MSGYKGKQYEKFILLSKEDLQRAIQKAPKFTGSYWQSLNLQGKKGVKGSVLNHTEFPLTLVDFGAVHGAFVKPPALVKKFETGAFTLNSGSQDGPVLAGVTYSINIPGDIPFTFTLGLRNDGQINGQIVQGSPGRDRYGKYNTDGKDLLKGNDWMSTGRYVEGRTKDTEIVWLGFQLVTEIHENQSDPQINFILTEDRP